MKVSNPRLFEVENDEPEVEKVVEEKPSWLFQMRRSCICGNKEGRVIIKGTQQTVRCTACSRFQYNASKFETQPPK